MKQKETEDKEQYRIKEGGIDVEVKIIKNPKFGYYSVNV